MEFSSADFNFVDILCTGADIVWTNMQAWVVTDAGEGRKTTISGTVITPACEVQPAT